ncbi:MAG: hypothetical protein AAB558_04085 [Patescibacteria group bacterium]
MGRTVPSMTQQILMELQSWSQFRRALRVEEREVFDELFRSVRMHVAEVSMAARLLPFEAMLMSMLVSQGVRLRQLEQQIFKLENRGGQASEALPQIVLALPHSPGQVS